MSLNEFYYLIPLYNSLNAQLTASKAQLPTSKAQTLHFLLPYLPLETKKYANSYRNLSNSVYT